MVRPEGCGAGGHETGADGPLTGLEERARAYGLFSLLFARELTPAEIIGLRSGGTLDQMKAVDPSFVSSSLEGDLTRVTEQLACEYARLFVGPRPLLPPYQSCHDDRSSRGGRRLWSETTSKVYRLVRDLGLDFGEAYHGIPDHISLVLELMQRLLAEEAQALKDEDADKACALRKVRLTFFLEHVATWGTGFFSKVGATTVSPFYRSLARLACRFLSEEVSAGRAEEEAAKASRREGRT